MHVFETVGQKTPRATSTRSDESSSNANDCFVKIPLKRSTSNPWTNVEIIPSSSSFPLPAVSPFFHFSVFAYPFSSFTLNSTFLALDWTNGTTISSATFLVTNTAHSRNKVSETALDAFHASLALENSTDIPPPPSSSLTLTAPAILLRIASCNFTIKSSILSLGISTHAYSSLDRSSISYAFDNSFSSSTILSTSFKHSSNIFSSRNISKCSCFNSSFSSSSWNFRASFRMLVSASRSSSSCCRWFSSSSTPRVEADFAPPPSFSSSRSFSFSSSFKSSKNSSQNVSHNSTTFSRSRSSSPPPPWSLNSSNASFSVRAIFARFLFDSDFNFLDA